MPAATANVIRRQIVRRREAGESYAAIGRDLSLPYGTVRKVYAHYQDTGHLEPNYERCRRSGVRTAKAIYEAALAMKRAHRGWGAGLIWVELADQFEEQDLPSVRSLQRWFRQAQLTPPRRERQPLALVARGLAVHQVWALDAKEQIKLKDGSAVSWLTISDEASGAVLWVGLFPRETLVASPLAVKHGLQTAMTRTGETGEVTHG
ncbi:MAG: hypothetical protein U0694_19410 [Anaerolineae bacterium]